MPDNTPMLYRMTRINVESQQTNSDRERAEPLAAPNVIRDAEDACQESEEMRVALSESEQLKRAVVDSVADGIITISEKGIIESFNAAAERLFGYSCTEVIGHNISTLLPPPLREMYGAKMQRYIRIVTKKLAGVQREFMGCHKDGSLFPIELSVSELMHANRRLFTGIIRDIAERKATHAQLKKLSRAVEQCPSSVVITDVHGTIEYVNPNFIRLTGFTSEEAIGRNPRVLNSGKIPKATIKQMWDTILSGNEWRGELLNKKKNGELYWEFASISPICDDDGQITHFVAVKENITARKQAEEQLAKLNRDMVSISRKAGMSEVATGVLHNVGNVLNSVNVSVNCMLDQMRASRVPRLVQAVEMMNDRADDLSDFLTFDEKGKRLPRYLAQLAGQMTFERDATCRELAEVSKNVEHIKEIVAMQQSFGRVTGLLEQVDPTLIAEDAIKINTAALSRHGVELIREYEDQLPEITTEKHKVMQILVNLINNAEQAMSDSADKRVTVRVCRLNDETLAYHVHDNGVGIPGENMTQLFSHGFTTKKNGHGYGLHSSALAAKEVGGSLTGQSDGLGKGATFTLSLPINKAGIGVERCVK